MDVPKTDDTRVPEHVEHSIESIADIHRSAEQRVSPQQRRLERTTAVLGRPATTFAIVALVIVWVAVNLALGERAFDRPPFPAMQTVASLCALIMTTIILATENRQNRQSERRAQLALQMTTLTEAKVAKLIELVEKLRVDSPHLENREDPEAQDMTAATDPKRVLEAMDAQGAVRENPR
jgi:uncharacterized membrane protein